jgi:broad specificity phosphatase PhoE
MRKVGTGVEPKNRLRLPKRILLVRHGESLGNVDEEAYHTIPDWLIPITAKGEIQAREMGMKIRDIIHNEPIYVYYSPYLRTRQTMVAMMESLKENPIYGVREEPRITEQQFGNFQSKEMLYFKKQKQQFGNFYYRFPNGEAGLDVYNRVTSFIGSLFREWYSHSTDEEFSRTNVIIVTHGLSLRLFVMRWFHFTVHQFEQTWNPKNGAIIVMERMTKNKELDETSLPSEEVCEHLGIDGMGIHNSEDDEDEVQDKHSVQVAPKNQFSHKTAIYSPPEEEEDESESELDFQTMSSYEQLEMSSVHTPATVLPQKHEQPQEIRAQTDNPHSPLQENVVNTKTTFEAFVLTKESQDLLNFHLPKKPKKKGNKKFISWDNYNSIYQIDHEIEQDMNVIKNHPKLMEEVQQTNAPKKNDL